jgi:hypothetical protein
MLPNLETAGYDHRAENDAIATTGRLKKSDSDKAARKKY